MGMVEKNKNLFVVTLENGKQTYFNFTDGNIYGVSGKVIQNFSAEAKKVLREASNENFLAEYFTDRIKAHRDYWSSPHWNIGMVETIYSLFNETYNSRILGSIATFCYDNDYELNKNNIKILKKAVEATIENDRYVDTWSIKKRVEILKEGELPKCVTELLCEITNIKNRKIIIADAKKIAFRMEHECWNNINLKYYLGSSVPEYVSRYITLCERLNKERDYKNLFLSVCLMEKENELISEKICSDYQTKAPLFYENDNFTVVVPTTAEEFKAEADYQQNCVFRLYYPKVKECETHVVFIRKKDNVEVPYITCEVSNDGKIVQYLTRFNGFVKDLDALGFRYEYERFLSENF